MSSENKKFLPYILEGNLDSQSLLIFLHGYPDSMQLWDSMVEDLKKDHTCLRISYPNFHPSYKEKWGINFDPLFEKIKELIDFLDEKKGRKKTFVMHDFGALIGFSFDCKYPGYLSDIISLDIGLGRDYKPRMKMFLAFIFTMVYQFFLMTAFLIGGFIGRYMTRSFLYLIKRSGYTPKNEKDIDSSINYMYYYLLRQMIIGVFVKKKRVLYNYKRSCPMAFIFGLNKPFMFHSEKFLRSLMEEEKCEVHAVKGGHWVMIKHKDLIVDIIQRRTK